LDYKEIYGAKLKGEVEFNAVKTWIEYVNRLLGVFTGLLIFATLLASIPYLRTSQPRIFFASLSAFILVGFQGWLGSKVVSTELHPFMVTLHMIVAIVIVFILLLVLTKTYAGKLLPEKVEKKKMIKLVLVVALILSFSQVMLGTQVRESMDMVIRGLGYTARNEWVEGLGLSFYIHRSFSILVLVSNALVLYGISKFVRNAGTLYSLAKLLMALVLVEVLTGIIMAYFAVPAFAQPIHLTVAIMMLGIQFVIWTSLDANKELKNIMPRKTEALVS
jgi:cytochrome c oxidase assembly protein subunit 15